MKIKKHKIYASLGMLYYTFILFSCTKFLDEKAEISVSIPETITDLRLMLDDASRINQAAPGLIELGSDDYAVDYTVFRSRPLFEQQVYMWNPKPQYQQTDLTLHWVNPYAAILIANVVQESLSRIKEGTAEQRAQIEGEAHFIRAFYYFMLSQLYADPYELGKDNNKPGVVYRPSSDFNQPSYRPNIEQVYQDIIEDLLKAKDKLPLHQDIKTRPSQQAAYALLARVYLSMQEYEKAAAYADLALSFGKELIDFNTLPISSANPFQPMNKEVIYHAICNAASYITASRSHVAPALYQSYDTDDLRKKIYFNPKSNGNFSFKASYSGSGVLIFTGLAIDELYYIKAEALARINKLTEACQMINTIRRMRWAEGKYTEFSSSDQKEVLEFILKDRRRGLLFRGLRWSDLRRLNKEDNWKVTITREFEDNDLRSELKPNDLVYTYLLPDAIIQMTGLAQNAR